MLKYAKHWLAVGVAISAVGLLGASSCQNSRVDLTIFHTNDLHSQLRAPKADPFGLGGIARLSTLLKTLRGQTKNSITVDAGDWSEGNWYYVIDEGANMLRLLSTMGFDATCLGNHDFLSGPDTIVKKIDAAKPTSSW